MGAGLFAKASVRSELMYLTHRFREQARSHIKLLSFTDGVFTDNPLWERACSRRRQHIQH